MEMNRRRYLTTIGTTASALAFAGCSEDTDTADGDDDNSPGDPEKRVDEDTDTADGDDDNSPGDPEKRVEEYYSALDDGDIEKINGLRHSDSPEFNENNIGFFIDRTTLKKTEVIEQSEDRATVDIFAEIFGKPNDEVLELRTENGEWKLYFNEDE